MSDRPLPAADVRAVLRGALPTDTSPQVLADQLVPGLIAGRRGVRVLDLGCGRGDSVDAFRAADVRWTGVDLPGSEELAKRGRDDAPVVTFDGVAPPFRDASFDVVVSKQVLEHVERPAELLPEVTRVLAPGGTLAGSTSQLIARRLSGMHPHFDRYWARASPLNRLIDGAGRALGRDAEDRNAVKLLVCGHYVFVARRPAG
jgi:SAM-dependent methyltransferase